MSLNAGEKQETKVSEVVERNRSEDDLELQSHLVSEQAFDESINHNLREAIRTKMQYKEESKMLTNLIVEYEQFSQEERDKAEEYLYKMSAGQSVNKNKAPVAFTHLQEIVSKDNEKRRLKTLKEFYEKIAGDIIAEKKVHYNY